MSVLICFDLCIPEMKLCDLPKQNYNVLSPNFRIHVPESDLYIPRIGLPTLLQQNRGRPTLGIFKALTDT